MSRDHRARGSGVLALSIYSVLEYNFLDCGSWKAKKYISQNPLQVKVRCRFHQSDALVQHLGWN